MEGVVSIGEHQYIVSGDEHDTNFTWWREHGCPPRERVPYQVAIHPGDICCDIGANIGVTALMIRSCCGPTGHVVAFEAAPSNYIHLQHTMMANSITNCELVNAAVGASNGALHVVERGPHSHVVPASTPTAVGIPMIALDDWWSSNGRGRLAFLKIDVEGYEIEVLKGASRTILQHRPRLLIEFNSLAIITLWKIAPYALLDAIMLLYPHVALVDRQTGLPVELDRTPPACDAFVLQNLRTGFVDDLLCWFDGDAPVLPQ